MRLGIAFLLVAACGSPHAAAPAAPAEPTLSPLSLAVWRGDDAEARRLLDAGADPGEAGAYEMTPWSWAIAARDEALTHTLLAAARIDARDPLVPIALRLAIAMGDTGTVDELLDRGVPVDAPDDAHTTPLVVAAANGDTAMVRRLLDAGADPDLVDYAGDTAMQAAARVGSDATMALLASRGADGAAPAPATTPPADPLAAALAVLQRGADDWLAITGCTSCHVQPMIAMATTRAARAGLAIDEGLWKVQRERILEDEADFADDARDAMATSPAPRAGLAIDEGLWKVQRERILEDEADFADDARDAMASDEAVLEYSMGNGGDVAFGTSWFLTAELDAGLTDGGVQVPSAQALARMQQRDGSWRPGPLRGVIESSAIETTALAAHVIDALAPDADRVSRARAFLEDASPRTIVDHAFRLRGLVWTDAGADAIAAEVAAIRGLQRDDGSWSQLDGDAGDAYSTGLVLVALHDAAGVGPDDPAYRAGVAWLLATQEADGSWRVHSRAAPLLPYVDAKFPHGKLQFLSFAGTAWALMALLPTVDGSSHARGAIDRPGD